MVVKATSSVSSKWPGIRRRLGNVNDVDNDVIIITNSSLQYEWLAIVHHSAVEIIMCTPLHCKLCIETNKDLYSVFNDIALLT